MPIDAAYAKVERLVKDFKALSPAARRAYNEDNTRKNFILPLFDALEWSIQSDDVSAEEKVSRGFVDFAFRIDGVPRFFLETKKIAEDLTKPEWVRQTVDYAWIKGVTWALLSDFEGLRVFNAEWKEYDPLQAQFIEFSVDTYLSDFERLWWLSRGETEQGRLDREAEKVGKRTKRLPVNQHLFDDLREWRQDLFKEFHAYNPKWSAAQIDEAVLKLLNRLIFIRTLEDRQVESVQLKALVHEAKDRGDYGLILKGLRALFRRFDDVYDSELFRASLIDQLDATSQPLEKMIDGLYGTSYFTYDFNAIDADVLGTVYEQYLGHIVTNPQAAEVVEKRTKRKSQGIFYTPTFVVKYIVQQTVGKYLAEHGYNESHPPRVLDLACGSGSFLIEAFDTLDRFVADKRGHTRGGQQGLHDHARRLEILQQCIFGVDKDQQAVEVARLNLLLKASFEPARLPLLHNIVHADSLRLDWDREFKDVMKNGGFDIIIGNPPYVRQEKLGDDFKTYAQGKFVTYTSSADLYVYFIEQAHKLLKPNGYFGMICSNKFMRSDYGKALRGFLATKSTLLEIIDFGELPVFQDAATFPAIILTRNRPATEQHFVYAPIKRLDFASLTQEVEKQGANLSERALQGTNWSLTQAQESVILEKMSQEGVSLHEYINGQVFRGIITGLTDAFVIDRLTRDRLIAEDPQSSELIKPFIVGDDVRKYHINARERYLILIPNGWTRVRLGASKDAWKWFRQHFSALAKHLAPFEEVAEKRNDKGEYWWELRECDYYAEFEKPKIIYPEIAKESRFAFDTNAYYSNNKAFIIPHQDFYLLGLLNSKLCWLFLKRVCSVLGDPDKGGRLQLQYVNVKTLPIRRIDFTNHADKRRHDRIVALVEEMLQLHKDLAEAERNHEDNQRAALQKRIARVDEEIDQIVYELYGLTEEEIKIVEGQ